MNKRIIMVLVIALLVVSFAAARVINFSIGPAFGFYKGEMPLNEDGSVHSTYKGTGFGFDTTFALTFGDRAELYFQDSFLFSSKIPFDQDPEWYDIYDAATLDAKTHIGFEFAVVTSPVKVSVGGGIAAEVLVMAGLQKPSRETGNMMVIVNVGVGGTAKVEYQFSNNWSAYAKVYADYLFVTAASGAPIPVPEGYEPPKCVGRYGNFSIDGSLGIILHF